LFKTRVADPKRLPNWDPTPDVVIAQTESHAIGALSQALRDLDALKELRRATREILRKEKLGQVSRISGDTFRIDQQLHEMAINALDNQLITDFYRLQQDRLRLIRINIRASTDHEPGLSDHIHILDALCQRDAAGAVTQLLAHLKNVEQNALDMLARTPHIKRLPSTNSGNGKVALTT